MGGCLLSATNQMTDSIFKGESMNKGSLRYLIWFTPTGIIGLLFLVGLIVLFLNCISEPEQREHWRDCGSIVHEECLDVADPRACEYEHYEECVNGWYG